ncbi:MAG: glycosyltransferase, partial [Clostridium sp.]|nr:glycosyltransferase [Clostridium sp.]
ENKISYWVSEPDKGIYDAMNKGIDIATGDYVYFLGADDWLVDKNVIENVFKNIYLNSGFDFYCGKVYLYDSIYNLVKESGQFHSIEEIKKGAMYPHQGMFVKLEIIKEKFDIDYKIAADYELFVRNIINGTKIHFFDKVIACYNIAGSSASSQLYDEYITIIKKYFGEEYTKEILLLKEYALSNFSLRKVIKWIINSLRIRKVFLIAKGWKKYDYSRI